MRLCSTLGTTICGPEVGWEEVRVELVQLVSVLVAEVNLGVFRNYFGRIVQSESRSLLLQTRQLLFDILDWIPLGLGLTESVKDTRRDFELGVQGLPMFSLINHRLIQLGGIAFVLPIMGLLSESL